MSFCYVVKRLYKLLALPLNHSTNIHLVRDAAVVGALATGAIISLQIHHGRKASQLNKEIHGGISAVQEKLDTIKEKLDTIKENMVTKEDMKNCLYEITRQHPCLRDVKSVVAGEPK